MVDDADSMEQVDANAPKVGWFRWIINTYFTLTGITLIAILVGIIATVILSYIPPPW
jgi:hypothetical protein